MATSDSCIIYVMTGLHAVLANDLAVVSQTSFSRLTFLSGEK
jgi:hypothetical protein